MPKIGVFIEGGVLQEIRSDDPTIEVILFDQDNYECESDEVRDQMDEDLVAINALPEVIF